MNRLEDIGFYTLSEERARTASATSPLQRCELVVTGACNFSCPYCRGLPKEADRTLRWADAKVILDYWLGEGLRNVRFTGGEPTLWKPLRQAVSYCAQGGVEGIALSTNGSADCSLYEELVDLGLNDISVSLDACCADTANEMAGRAVPFQKILDNIRRLSPSVYVTIGVVLTPRNIGQLSRTVELAWNLGVEDVRIIPAAQWAPELAIPRIPNYILEYCPILRYRIGNLRAGRKVRSLSESDPSRCPLVLDDMAVAGDYHYPCIIYLREHGKPIGKLEGDVRKAREDWFLGQNTHNDPICRANCLDVCVDYNTRWEYYHNG